VKVMRPNERVAGNGDAIAGAAMGPAVERVRLPDGRRLACRQYGPADGKPVLYMPGTPSCTTEWRMWPASAADQLNMRVIAVDRPGLGGSDPLPRRRIADWPADVEALADALGLSRFAILGYSGGVPYALSCAEALPDRVSKAALVGCVGPGNIAGMAPAVARSRQMCLHRPRRAWITWWGVRLAARRFPGRLIDQTLQALPEPDRRTLADPEFARVYTDVLSDALDAGPAGACQDMALMTGDWGLHPDRIRIPVTLWQGGQDTNAPPQTARQLADAIPGCDARFFCAEGHLSIIISHGRRILADLAQDEP
jgi:pimeloyl-ACP methyl ester carboxylesterase